MKNKIITFLFLFLYSIGILANGITPSNIIDAKLINEGRRLFFQETFAGNGRTCGTCHPANNNFTIDPEYIAKLPENDPLFVAEYLPALAENFEKPELMRKLGLILENTNGFTDLEHNFTMRSVPHILAMQTSVTPPGEEGMGLFPLMSIEQVGVEMGHPLEKFLMETRLLLVMGVFEVLPWEQLFSIFLKP